MNKKVLLYIGSRANYSSARSLLYAFKKHKLLEPIVVLGAAGLVDKYGNLEDLIKCSQEGNPDVQGFESSVFDGQYLTGVIDNSYLEALEAARGDGSLRQEAGALVGIHNGG